MISWHPGKPDPARPWQYASGFKVADTDDVARLAKGISHYVWSGIVWQEGQRGEGQFLLSDWCVMDFDDPEMTLAEACKIFCDCTHIIGTTKSHQKPKGANQPACDRFRVMVRWQRRITDLREYKFNMRRLVKAYPVDEACLDGARYFFPCVDIVQQNADGYMQAVKSPPKDFGLFPKRRSLPGFVSPWAKSQLDIVVPEGERTMTFHRVAKDFYRAGHGPDDIFRLIVQSQTYQGSPSEHAQRKLREAIRSAVKAVTKEVEDERRDEGTD